MVYRIFVEKKPGQTHEADKLLKDVQEFLQIASLKAVRVINRYDVENIDEALFENAVRNVFSEPQVDNTYAELDAQGIVFAVEPLPGQFDQRADSAAQCIQIISQGERPLVRTAKVYILSGELTAPSQEDHTTLRLGQVREIIDAYIREHYAEELSMQDVARAMNYSDAYFCKLFKQCFKINFSAYLNEYRIARAREMLQNTRLNVREISIACGYSDANYFARVFKRVTGMTPTEYRVI